MTKRLEEVFNLPDSVVNEPEVEEQEQLIAESQEKLTAANDIIDRIDQALPQVSELDLADNELDELSDIAKEKFEDLMSLGMNVEARYSGTILQTAGVLLGHAIAAKQAKIDKKLRMVDLQLKKMRLDQQAAKDGDKLPPIEGHATVIDRNELLKQILLSSKGEKSSK